MGVNNFLKINKLGLGWDEWGKLLNSNKRGVRQMQKPTNITKIATRTANSTRNEFTAVNYFM